MNDEISKNARFSSTHIVEADCTGTDTVRIDLEDGIQVTHYALFTPRWQYRYAFVQTDPAAVAPGFTLRGTAKRVED